MGDWKPDQPCKAGKGSFIQKLKQDARVDVGTIPAGINNAYVKLDSVEDVDTEMWAQNGEKNVAVIAWRTGIINSATKASTNYAGAKITYSGYNGIPGKDGKINLGHEDIRLTGKATKPLVM